jgi:osmotically inducible protein OsmC
MPTNVLYSTSARAVGGRDGHVATLDGTFSAKLTTPKDLGGPGGEGNNPEQLFAAGYAACFLNAMKYTAMLDKVPFPADASVTSTVGIGPRSEGGFGLDIALAISLPGLQPDLADTLMKKGHAICPYSNAVRGNIDVKLSMV